jgi:hypothetical protein
VPWWLARTLGRIGFELPFQIPARYGFAIERNTAEVVLRTLLQREARPETPFELHPISELRGAAREDNGAIFPDGFAIWPRELESKFSYHPVRWEQYKGTFIA